MRREDQAHREDDEAAATGTFPLTHTIAMIIETNQHEPSHTHPNSLAAQQRKHSGSMEQGGACQWLCKQTAASMHLVCSQAAQLPWYCAWREVVHTHTSWGER